MRKLLQVLALGLVAAPVVGGAAGCNRKGEFSPVDMWNRSRIKTYEPIDFFPDRTAYRQTVPGTVARGQMFKADDAFYRGIASDGKFVTALPASVLRDYAQGKDAAERERNLLAHGQERYQIYCSMCHGYSGHGNGMVVQRGFVPPPDYRIKRLRDAPMGHFFDVITNGYGAMYSYSTRVPVQDRWAIAAYIRRLQEVQPDVVPDVRYNTNSNSGREKEGKPATFGSNGMMQAAPRVDKSTIGTNANPGSSSQVRAGESAPQPKNPMQALPQPGAVATPGLDDR